MKKVIGLTLLACMPFGVQAACQAIPFQMSADNYNYFIGELPKGGECRGVTRRGNFTALHYTFPAKAGEVLIGDDITGGPCGTCASNTYFSLLDPQGVRIATASNRGGRLVGSRFEVKLNSTGDYKLVITGDTTNVENVATGMINYALSLQVVPATTSNVAVCPSDTYDKGKLTINAVEVPNGFGGVLKYQATLALQPFSSPVSFVLEKAEPLQ